LEKTPKGACLGKESLPSLKKTTKGTLNALAKPVGGYKREGYLGYC